MAGHYVYQYPTRALFNLIHFQMLNDGGQRGTNLQSVDLL